MSADPAESRPAGIYRRCPKCGHAPLPADQALPAACPSCGLILAKYGVSVPKPHAPEIDFDAAGATPARQWRDQLLALVTRTPERVDPLAFWARVGLLAAFGLWGIVLIRLDVRTGGMGDSFLHGPLLVFHEAGHVIFRLFGEFMTILGGTLGQLLMPAILCGALLVKNRDPFGAAIGLWLLGASLLDVAPYVYDALHPQLVLLGGHTGEEGGHDWIYLLGETGLLKRAQSLGWLTHKLGALVVLFSLGWGAWLLKRQYARLGKGGDGNGLD